MTLASRVRGCLLGGALGDALGEPIEFWDADRIRREHPDGVSPAAVAHASDDTQMTLFTAEALIGSLVHGTEVMPALQSSYGRWLATQTGSYAPDTWLHSHRDLWAQRAPGMTCLSALRTNSGANDSKGCGGVMRAAPAGFLPSEEAARSLGCDLAALTHGHPSGFLAAGALSLLIHLLGVRRQSPADAVASAIEWVSTMPSGEEVRRSLEAACSARDVASLGEGWVAEETLAIAVYAVLAHPGDAVAALRLAVSHSGDSDSTGAVAGNIFGAAYGEEALPQEWLARVDLGPLVGEVADDLVAALSSPPAPPLSSPARELRDRYPA